MRLLILREAGWKSCSTVGDIAKRPMQQNVRLKGSVSVLGGCGGNHPRVAGFMLVKPTSSRRDDFVPC